MKNNQNVVPAQVGKSYTGVWPIKALTAGYAFAYSSANNSSIPIKKERFWIVQIWIIIQLY